MTMIYEGNVASIARSFSYVFDSGMVRDSSFHVQDTAASKIPFARYGVFATAYNCILVKMAKWNKSFSIVFNKTPARHRDPSQRPLRIELSISRSHDDSRVSTERVRALICPRTSLSDICTPQRHTQVFTLRSVKSIDTTPCDTPPTPQDL